MQRKWYAPPVVLCNALAPIHVGRFLILRGNWAVLAWTAVLIAAAAASYLAWTGYDEEGRPDSYVGYIYIDFSGQWLMGRMLARGEGPYLYNREHLHPRAPGCRTRSTRAAPRPATGRTPTTSSPGSSRRPSIPTSAGRSTRRSTPSISIRWGCCRRCRPTASRRR